MDELVEMALVSKQYVKDQTGILIPLSRAPSVWCISHLTKLYGIRL